MTEVFRPRLSSRLTALVELVSPGGAVLDVGTDHAYVPIALVQSGRKESGMASDVREGPLARAKEHVRDAGLSDVIQVIQADGIPGEVSGLFAQGEGHSLIISGMGADLVLRILTEGAAFLPLFREVIVSPQSDWYKFRREVTALGFAIDEERMLREEEKDYLLLRLVPPGSQKKAALRETELYAGPVLLARRDETLKTYLLRRDTQLAALLIQLKAEESARAGVRVVEIEKERDLLHEALGTYGDT